MHIGDYHVDSYLVASIIYDYDFHGEDEYWRVMINGNEIYRATSPAQCYEYIKEHYYKGTLPEQEQLPPDEPFGTGNEIMAQIFTLCEKHGLELLEDRIYRSDTKLGSVGCTDGSWWFIRVDSQNQQPIFCC
ncbi:hypothetical protein JYQ62_10625 [Nostoc sp. UHCC 0702]|nr:hypothetical protein JYQ62_10625 [Nostoc sp. UHCC 0702]